MKKISLALALIFLSSSTFACPSFDQTSSFAPPRLSRNVTVFEGTLTKQDADSVVEIIKKKYVPIFSKAGIQFEVLNMWDDPDFNFETHRLGSKNEVAAIALYGGMTRNKFMTKDGLLLATCHEVGHHLGGFPKKTSRTWSSVEGQADYFAALKCVREIWKNSKENVLAEKADLPEQVKTECRQQYANIDSYRICLRTAKAGEDLGKLLYLRDLGEEWNGAMLLQSTLTQVTSTNFDHPDPFCRVENFFQAALCSRASDANISDTDETSSVCHERNGDIVGMRSRCWFKPN